MSGLKSDRFRVGNPDSVLVGKGQQSPLIWMDVAMKADLIHTLSSGPSVFMPRGTST